MNKCSKTNEVEKNMTNDSMKPTPFEPSSKADKKAAILGMIQQIMNGKVRIDPIDDDANQGFRQDRCPHNQCDGSGYISEWKDGEEYSNHCECYKDAVLQRKMKNANIQQDYWHADLSKLHECDVTLLYPKKAVQPRKIDKRYKEDNQPPEKEDAFIARVYDEKPVKKGIHFFAQQYTEKTLTYLDETPRTKSKNLILIGETGRQKTFLACSIGVEFLKQNKSVYFSTMQDLLNNVYNNKIDLEKIVTETDLLIIDELSNEYHTDNQWALKQMKEMFRLRKNRNLPTVCTSNYYPNAWEELYDKPFVSTLNGSFFITLLASDTDFRIEQMQYSYDDYEFFE